MLRACTELRPVSGAFFDTVNLKATPAGRRQGRIWCGHPRPPSNGPKAPRPGHDHRATRPAHWPRPGASPSSDRNVACSNRVMCRLHMTSGFAVIFPAFAASALQRQGFAKRRAFRNAFAKGPAPLIPAKADPAATGVPGTGSPLSRDERRGLRKRGERSDGAGHLRPHAPVAAGAGAVMRR
jgi:hypothetical protein